VNSGPNRGWTRTIWHLALTALVIWFIGQMTLHSAKLLPSRNTFLCLWGCDGEELRDTLSNIVLFVPLGWVLRYWIRPWPAFALCLLATIGIESAQAFLLVGRDPSLRDILTNAAGGAIGIGIFDHWRRILHADQRTSRRLALGFFAAWTATVVATGYGLRASGSEHPWFGHWGNHLAYYAPFSGRLESVKFGDWTPPSGPLPEPNPLQESIAHDSIDLHVVAVTGQVTRPVALIFAVMDEYDNEIVFVGGAERSVQFQARTRLVGWGLRGIAMRLPLPSNSLTGDTLDITARLRADAWRLTLRSQGRVDSIALPLTVGLGWATLLPAPLAISIEWHVMNALWLGVLVIPAIYWWLRARPGRGWLEGAGAVGSVLLLAPLLAGIAPSSASDWMGGAIGLITGALLARRSRQRHPAA
jgi:hypothetical protein